MINRVFLVLLSAFASISPGIALASDGKPHDWDSYKDVPRLSVNLEQGSHADGRPEDWGSPANAIQVYGKPDDWGRSPEIQGKPEDWDKAIHKFYSFAFLVGSLFRRQ